MSQPALPNSQSLSWKPAGEVRQLPCHCSLQSREEPPLPPGISARTRLQAAEPQACQDPKGRRLGDTPRIWVTGRQSSRPEAALSILPALTPVEQHAQTSQVPARRQPHPQQETLSPVASGLGLPEEDCDHPVPAAVWHLPVPHEGTGQDSPGNVSTKFSPIPQILLPFPLFLLSSSWQASILCAPHL